MKHLNAQELARYIVAKYNENKIPINNIQLNGLLYVLRVLYLQKDKNIFYHDIIADRFGPCIKNVYYEWCHFGAMPLELHTPLDVEITNEKDRQFIDNIIKTFQNLSLIEKRKIYKSEPYQKALKTADKIIDTEDMKHHNLFEFANC